MNRQGIMPPVAKEGGIGDAGSSTLVCFAVVEEAVPFRRLRVPGTEILVSQMGQANAERRFLERLRAGPPMRVLTCGFAGGLNPALRSGTVVFDCDPGFPLEARLRAAGAVEARFLCTKRVAVTVGEKTALRASSGADAVEMESGVIRRICRERGIPAATIRVISDEAGEDLPVDFNALMRPDGRLDFPRLILTLLGSPGRIGGMIRLGGTTSRAARSLAKVLAQALAAEPPTGR